MRNTNLKLQVWLSVCSEVYDWLGTDFQNEIYKYISPIEKLHLPLKLIGSQFFQENHSVWKKVKVKILSSFVK